MIKAIKKKNQLRSIIIKFQFLIIKKEVGLGLMTMALNEGRPEEFFLYFYQTHDNIKYALYESIIYVSSMYIITTTLF